jgi:hypothetical protein
MIKSRVTFIEDKTTFKRIKLLLSFVLYFMIFIIFFECLGFQVTEEAKQLLKGINEKIGVIAVAGKYRTGKSFLLNRIILNKQDDSGFGVGPTINPCTKVFKNRAVKNKIGSLDLDQAHST